MAVAAGAHLGPYEIVEPLGAGGMGEVYRARDPRLGRDVAVKLISTDGAPAPDRLRRFETEARTAARINHPNVVTVHDVGTHDGRPYLVLELLSGETLREVLRDGTPPVRQAVTWAMEVARGLAAAHELGIVHRDLKPENVVLMKKGGVKVLDFGLARFHEPLVASEADRESPTATKGTSPGVVLGTIGYMSPEQVKGLEADARSDVFAVGTLLYEMVSGRRAFEGETPGDVLASILRDEPPSLLALVPSAPASLESVVRRCLAKRPADRISSAGEVAVALETALASLEPARTTETRGVAEARGPYPGLSAFTEADAERFYGRESEIEALWDKARRQRLLALIGPSGAGKSSFVRAGLVPRPPTGWGVLVATPGGAPLRSLAQALVGELPSDPDTMRELLAFDDPEVAFKVVRKWRQSQLEGLLVVDQFEELFTLCAPEAQETFASLLGRLAAEGDVHVLLSLRDDFLMRCHEHEPLVPVFEHLTPLGPLSEDGLRRAITEPARKEGVAFEDEALVAEILESVEGARGALPLLAFAVARLWEKRDREKKLLTRKAYEEIGGVGGALAQHAEQTLERIGLDKEPVVRELFRNLVTAQWTRAVAEREELLSVLPDPEVGESVLNVLIDARLLTSYEVRAEGGPGESDQTPSTHHRIEVVHESLLRAWPRLVRWQAQDEEGAVLRDQLKQAAHLWEEKSRSPDLLWTGDAFQEFQVWRRRYAGKLTTLEEEYAAAMGDRARRRRRVRRTIGASVLVASLLVAAVTAALWWRSERASERARAEARRAEASRVLALGELRLDEDPTEALAYATASLELADSEEARIFATKTLWTAPPALLLEVEASDARDLVFNADGTRLAASAFGAVLPLWTDSGRTHHTLPGHRPDARGGSAPRWSSSGLLVTAPRLPGRVHVWTGEGEELRTIDVEGPGRGQWCAGHDDLLVQLEEPGPPAPPSSLRLLSCPLAGGEPRELGRVRVPEAGPGASVLTPDGRGRVLAEGRDVLYQPLPVGSGPEVRLGRHRERVVGIGGTSGDELRSRDASGEWRVWAATSSGWELRDTATRPESASEGVWPDRSRRWWVEVGDSEGRIWRRDGLPGARPLRLRRSGLWGFGGPDVPASGDWFVAATHDGGELTFWPLRRPYPTVVDGYENLARPLSFSPDGRWLATGWKDGVVRLWPVAGNGEPVIRRLGAELGWLWVRIAFSPQGEFVFVVGNMGRAAVMPLDGSPVRQLQGFSGDSALQGAAVSRDGRRVATADMFGSGKKTLRIWDLETDTVQILDLPRTPDPDGKRPDRESEPMGYDDGVMTVQFVGPDTLYTAGDGGILRWDVRGGTHERVLASEPGTQLWLDLTPDGRAGLAVPVVLPGQECRPPLLVDLEKGEFHPLPEFGDCAKLGTTALQGDLVVTGDYEGIIRVGRLGGGPPHLLVGHKGPVNCVALSPDLRWVASTGEDDTLRLWPMPDLDEVPLHALPREGLITKLHSLTNLRAVRDPEAEKGWSLQTEPFPGWEDVPTW